MTKAEYTILRKVMGRGYAQVPLFKARLYTAALKLCDENILRIDYHLSRSELPRTGYIILKPIPPVFRRGHDTVSHQRIRKENK